MGYLSNKGVLAGPIQIPSTVDSQATWIVQEGSNLYFSQVAKRPQTVDQYGTTLWAKTSLEGYNDPKECQNMVATVGWVMQNFKSESLPTFSPNDFVSIPLYNELVARVEKDEDDILDLQQRVLVLENTSNIFRNDIQTNKNNIQINATNIEKLRNDFTKYVDDPFPNGVIFIAGGAEVVE